MMSSTKPKTIYAIHCRPTKRTFIGCSADYANQIRIHLETGVGA